MNNRLKMMAILVAMAPLLAGCAVRLAKYEPVVRGVVNGTFSDASSGVVDLPREFAGVTPRDEIFVEKKPDGRTFIFFPTWYGRGDDIEGYLYCTGAGLLPSDYYSTEWGQGRVHQHIDVAGRQWLSVEPYKPNWYWVTRRLD